MIQQLQQLIKLRLGTGRYRTIAIELGRKIRGLVMKQVEGLVGEEDDDSDGIEFDPVTGEPIDTQGSWNIVRDLRSTHGTKIARMGYVIHIALPGRLQPEMIAAFQAICQLWHRLLLEGMPFSTGWNRSAVDNGAGTATKKKRRETSNAEEVEQQMVEGFELY